MFFDERETEVGTCSRPHWVSGGKEEAGWEQGLLGTAVSSNPNSFFERQLSAHYPFPWSVRSESLRSATCDAGLTAGSIVFHSLWTLCPRTWRFTCGCSCQPPAKQPWTWWHNLGLDNGSRGARNAPHPPPHPNPGSGMVHTDSLTELHHHGRVRPERKWNSAPQGSPWLFTSQARSLQKPAQTGR